MGLIYNNNNKDNPNNPIIYDGMSLGAVNFYYNQGNLNFPKCTLKLTDVSYLFASRREMTETPEINLNGKIGLDTIFYGCEQLILIRCVPRLIESFRIYNNPERTDSKVLFLNILNYTIGQTENKQIKKSSFVQVPDIKVKKINGIYIEDATGESILDVYNNLGWSIV